MDDLDGFAQCVRPPHHDAANAVGAAISKIAGEVDVIEIMEGRDETEVLNEAKEKAVKAAIAKDADPDDVKVVDVDRMPLQYVTNKATRIRVKAAGSLIAREMSIDNVNSESDALDEDREPTTEGRHKEQYVEGVKDTVQVDIKSYRPEIIDEEWWLSEFDLNFIATGTSILGTGGGGSSYISYLMSANALREGGRGSMRVISPDKLTDDDVIALGSWYGAPSVSSERLPAGTEIPMGIDAVNKVVGVKDFRALLTLEIGGGNGYDIDIKLA